MRMKEQLHVIICMKLTNVNSEQKESDVKDV